MSAPCEFDGLTWPHYDGLIWPHPRPAASRPFGLIGVRAGGSQRGWDRGWSCVGRSVGTVSGRGCRCGSWLAATAFTVGRCARRSPRRCRRRAGGRRGVSAESRVLPAADRLLARGRPGGASCLSTYLPKRYFAAWRSGSRFNNSATCSHVAEASYAHAISMMPAKAKSDLLAALVPGRVKEELDLTVKRLLDDQLGAGPRERLAGRVGRSGVAVPAGSG